MQNKKKKKNGCVYFRKRFLGVLTQMYKAIYHLGIKLGEEKSRYISTEIMIPLTFQIIANSELLENEELYANFMTGKAHHEIFTKIGK